MKRAATAILLLACALLVPSLASATQIRAYIAEFTVSPPDSTGLKSTLQTLLSSRMASEAIIPVPAAAEADVIITGSYTQLGKVFSLDAVARLGSGRTLATVYEQGESQDDLIPALGRVSTKLKTEMLKRYPLTATAPPVPAAAAATPAATPAAAPPAAPAALSATPQMPPAQAVSQRGDTVWLSQRIVNAQIALAPGLPRSQGQEFFVAESHALRLYRQEKPLKLLAEVQFPLREKIIAIDSAGPDQDGNPRVYVTIMDGEAPASKIFSFEGAKLKPVATKLPYLFRAIAFNGGKSRIYAQQMSLSEDFFGDLYEVSETGAKIELKNPIKLPRYANIFNYNRVSGPDGKSNALALSTDGYLVVYSETGEEIWRSDEKFGGSETYFQRETGSNVRVTDDKFRWRFIDQRITVTSNGEIIVPQNSGFFVLGNNRSYSKHALITFSWNGSSLEELWRTKQSQNYLADYYLDDQTREIVLLEVVQKEGVFSKGGSAIRVIRAN